MKDEEIDKMADDFVNAQEFTKVYGFARKAECGAFWKYGFLAGLKAGRPQWHDLRENPNDLPIGEVFYWFDENPNLKDRKVYGRSIGYYNPCEKEWHGYYKGCPCRIHNVIAWCEIPTFDKE